MLSANHVDVAAPQLGVSQDEFATWLGRYVDRLVTVELRNPGSLQGTTAALHAAALAEAGGGPRTLAAAQLIHRAVSAGDRVLLVTGAGTQPLLPRGESDGPVGAVMLARILAHGLGARPLYVCEEHHAGPIAACSEAAMLPVRPLGAEPEPAASADAALVTAPLEQEAIEAWAAELLDRLHPTLIVAVERLSPNRAGVIHGSTGLAGWEPQVDLAALFRQATVRGIATVGIGDGGNEIGYGRIAGAVRELLPHGDRCQCPCEAGTAADVATDVLVVASVSNWGAYGVEACLAHLLGRPELVHAPAIERAAIERVIAAGAWDGVSCSDGYVVDGVDAAVSEAIVRMLGEMARLGALRPDGGPLHRGRC